MNQTKIVPRSAAECVSDWKKAHQCLTQMFTSDKALQNSMVTVLRLDDLAIKLKWPSKSS